MLAGADPRQLVFLDESGLDTRMTRSHARAPRGRRAIGRVPGGHWRRLTILGAIAAEGMVAAMTVAAATSTAVFVAFIEGVLAPALKARPGTVLVMDNLARTRPPPRGRRSTAPASRGATCRPTRPTSTRSSRPGRR